MEKLVINPTSTAQWHALVNDASFKCNTQLTEEIESYVVFLLMRFQGESKIGGSIIALELLEGLNLQAVGDKCLLFSGLFPGQAQKRRVRISYYVKAGQTAYSQLSNTSHTEGLQSLFGNLCEQFVSIMDVMHSMRELAPDTRALDLMQAEELWQDTKSQSAFNTLQNATGDGAFIVNPDFNSSTKH